LANIGSLRQFIDGVAKKLRKIDSSQNRIVKLMAPEVKKIIDELDKDKESDFQYALAKWFYQNGNFALSYIALYEAVITKACELEQRNPHDHKERETAKKRVGRISDHRYGRLFHTKYDDSISKIRNTIVHQHHDRKGKELQDIQRLESFLKTFDGYFNMP
jgi:hypothetical protein